MALVLCAVACGPALDGRLPDRILLPGQGRAANWYEHKFVELAQDLASARPCHRISPDAYSVAILNPRGRRIWLERSECFAHAAGSTRDPELCRHAKSVSTLLLSGSSLPGVRDCSERVKRIDDGRRLRSDALWREDERVRIMTELGFTREELVEGCERFLEGSVMERAFAENAKRRAKRWGGCASSDPGPVAGEVRYQLHLEAHGGLYCLDLYPFDPARGAPARALDLTQREVDVARAWSADWVREAALDRLDRLPDYSR